MNVSDFISDFQLSLFSASVIEKPAGILAVFSVKLHHMKQQALGLKQQDRLILEPK